jgi:hypothetical protein
MHSLENKMLRSSKINIGAWYAAELSLSYGIYNHAFSSW